MSSADLRQRGRGWWHFSVHYFPTPLRYDDGGAFAEKGFRDVDAHLPRARGLLLAAPCGKRPFARAPFIEVSYLLGARALARRGAVAKRTSGHRLRSLIHLLTQPSARSPLFVLSDTPHGHEQLLYHVVNRPRKLPDEVASASGLLLLSCGARSELYTMQGVSLAALVLMKVRL